MNLSEALQHLQDRGGHTAAFADDGVGVISYFDDPDYTGFFASDGETGITSQSSTGVTLALSELCIEPEQGWRVF